MDWQGPASEPPLLPEPAVAAGSARPLSIDEIIFDLVAARAGERGKPGLEQHLDQARAFRLHCTFELGCEFRI